MHILIPLLPQCGPLYVPVLIAPIWVTMFLDGISEIFPSGCSWKYRGFPLIPLLIVGFPLVLDVGGDFEEWKSKIFPIGKIMNHKYPSKIFNHLSMTYASIYPSNMGMSKLACTLKGVAPPRWMLDEDVSLVVIPWRIWEIFSNITFLCCSRDSSSNILKGYPTPSYLFLQPWETIGVGEAGIAMVQTVQALTPYTPTSLGTCIEK